VSPWSTGQSLPISLGRLKVTPSGSTQPASVDGSGRPVGALASVEELPRAMLITCSMRLWPTDVNSWVFPPGRPAIFDRRSIACWRPFFTRAIVLGPEQPYCCAVDL